MLMGKSLANEKFSIAMLNYRRVTLAFTIRWVNNHKPPIWEWFITHIYAYLGHGL